MTQAEPTTEAQKPVHTRALIIGTGFSGLGMAIRLQQQGVDFVILEKADDVGGTWRDNGYPGCACDIPSHLYSFSFEPKPDWKNPFSYQPEIWDYLKGVTEKYGLRRYIEFNSLVDRAYWDDDEYRWHVFTRDGREYVAQFLISGAGALHVPSFPDIEGRDEFAGPAFHSAEWDHNVDLTGKRVAIIGTGASAIQIVPEIAPSAAQSSGRSPNFSSTSARRRGWCRAPTPSSRWRCVVPWRTSPGCGRWCASESIGPKRLWRSA